MANDQWIVVPIGSVAYSVLIVHIELEPESKPSYIRMARSLFHLPPSSKIYIVQYLPRTECEYACATCLKEKQCNLDETKDTKTNFPNTFNPFLLI